MVYYYNQNQIITIGKTLILCFENPYFYRAKIPKACRLAEDASLNYLLNQMAVQTMSVLDILEETYRD
jgi:hypothetical protein